MEAKFVCVTRQPGAIGAAEVNAYGCQSFEDADGLGHIIADGAEPPMTFEVLEIQRPPEDA